MKTKHVIFLLLIILSYDLAIAQIPNASFEHWGMVRSGNGPWINTISRWDTQNIVNSIDGIAESSVKTADAIDSNYALVLTNVNTVRNEVAYASPYSYDTAYNFNEKFPIYEKPLTLTGFYKYSYAQTDIWSIQVRVYHNGTPIGYGKFASKNQVYSYTRFSAPITYTSSLAPDSASIVILAGSLTKFVLGSELYIDNLSFNSTTGIDDLKTEINASLHPNPSQGATYLEFEQQEKGTTHIIVTDVLGNKIEEREDIYAVGSHRQELNTSSIQGGLYFVTIRQGNSSKIIKLFIE
jgi:hypothetical protein